MVQLRERLGFAREASGERGVMTDAGRKNFQRHQAVQFLLPRLVNRAHAALADKFKDFELREQRRQFGNRRRLERWCLSAHGGLVGTLFQEAGGAESGKCASRQWRAALRTFRDVRRGHFGATHTPNPEANHDGCYRKKLENIQHSTSNAQHPMERGHSIIGCSTLGVGCWMFPMHHRSRNPP